MTAPELLALYSCHLPTSPGQDPKILKVRVRVLDTRELFKNRVDVKICPVAGEGEVWVSEKSLEFETPPEGAPDFRDQVVDALKMTHGIPKDEGEHMLDHLLGGTPICPECGAPIRWDQSPDAVPTWVHVISSECSGTKGLAEPGDAPRGQAEGRE